jgi:60 kDa SS-A/Ro ribonucleoprotein
VVVSVSKLNRGVSRPSNKIVNAAGGVGYSLSAQGELVSLLMSSLAEGGAYESGTAQTQRLAEVVTKVDPTFAAKAAVFARDEFGMRTITHLTAIALAPVSFDIKRAFYRAVVVRPDDALEILAGYGVNEHGRLLHPLPKAMQRGLADKLGTFSGYQLAKYKSMGKAVNMFDAINLVHAKSPAISSFMNGEETTADTWETELSGSKDKAASWKRLLSENRLGIMALLRNLRNIIEACGKDQDAMNMVVEQLTDEGAIMRSRLFPYRFLAAYETMVSTGFGVREMTVPVPQKILSAINKAAEVALVNVPELSGSSAILLDVSGSMNDAMSIKSKMRKRDAGSMLGAMLFKKNPECELIKFGTTAARVRVNADMPLLEIAKQFQSNDRLGHGTSIPAGMDMLSEGHERIFIVSDMQTWIGHSGKVAYDNYAIRNGSKPFAYEIAMGGYSQSALNDRDPKVFHLATISDKIFTLIDGLEYGEGGILNAINSVVL